MAIKILESGVLDHYLLVPVTDKLTRRLSDLEIISSRLRGLLAVEIHDNPNVCVRATDIVRLLGASLEVKTEGGAGDGNQEV